MTDFERELRRQIADEIANKFGSLAPYKLVQDFVRHGLKQKGDGK
ncbi:hypothetical protein [Planktotalea sp.]